ncbi:MAG: methyltransferase domain-containing protein [Rickettsiaceae bacterium]|nr:MAG: methyltransferase domain-containing protein [Rickettsiaceae bacterium]
MIFDRKKVMQHRNRASSNFSQAKFFAAIAKDVMNRIEPLDKNYLTVLDINCRNGHFVRLFKKKYPMAKILATDISSNMLASFEHQYKWQIDEEFILTELTKHSLSIKENYFDLINFSLGFHWINDVEKFLAQIYQLLKHDGIFIANFVGGNSLKKLRTKFINIESILNIPHSPHVSPFISFQDIPFLLQKAGFGDIIVDQDSTNLTYPSCYEFIKTIKGLGESNKLLNHTSHSLTKEMFSMLSICSEEFTDTINIINLIAGKAKNTIKMKA